MSERAERLEQLLESTVTTKEMIHKDYVGFLSQVEDAIKEVCFSETHGECLNVNDVITHLHNLAAETGKLNDPDYKECEARLYSFKGEITGVKLGIRGENSAAKALTMLHGEAFVLRNIELDAGGIHTEIDQLVIARNGIFIVEDKYRTRNVVISDSGCMMPEYGNNGCACNLVEQINAQKYVLRNLIGEEYEEYIHPIVLMTNSRCAVNNHCDDITICYCSNVIRVIEDMESPSVLSMKDMIRLRETVREADSSKLYKPSYDFDSLRRSYIRTVCWKQQRILWRQLADRDQKSFTIRKIRMQKRSTGQSSSVVWR